jgi:hypothetical protein
MPSLFVLPRQVPLSSAGALLAGAKLFFSQTGTSTAQNTYSDINLTVANANPVVADASGVFGKIYLDPSLPHYRVVLKTSADVTLYTEDDVPSNQNTTQSFRLKATAPALTFEETDASANNKIWRLKVNGEQLLLTILDDAEGVETTVLTFDRSGTTPGDFNFAGQYLKVQGLTTATQENASYASVTLTGCTTSPTGSVTLRRTGTKVTLILPALSATSNSTSMTITGLTGLNTSTGGVLLCRVIDNGTTQLGIVTVGSSTLTFGLGASGGSFTNSGTKGIPAQTIIFDTDIASTA